MMKNKAAVLRKLLTESVLSQILLSHGCSFQVECLDKKMWLVKPLLGDKLVVTIVFV
jgi:hypothetical protein